VGQFLGVGLMAASAAGIWQEYKRFILFLLGYHSLVQRPIS
jgi:hypothetical protein